METVRDFDSKYKLKAVAFAGLKSALCKGGPFLAISVVFGAAPSPFPDSLQTVRSGSYSRDASARARVTVLDWNIDRGKAIDDIEGQMR